MTTMNTPPNQNIEKGVITALLAMFFFSMSDGTRKMIAVHGIPVDHTLFWQGIFALIALILVSPFMSGGLKAVFTRQKLGWHMARAVLIALNTTFSIIAVSNIPMMDAYTIFFLTPFVTTILGMLIFKERFGISRWAAIFCGFLGAFVAFRPGFAELHWAYGFACACVFTFAFSSIIARYIGTGNGVMGFGIWPLFLLLSGLTIYHGGGIPPLHDSYFLTLCAIGGTCYGLALVLISLAYTLAPTSVIAPYQYVQIIFALGFGYLVFHDYPDAFKIVGAGIIIGSGIFLFIRERIVKAKQQKQPA